MNSKFKFILLLVLALGIFLRLYNLTQTPPGLYPDEAMNGNNALEALRTGEFKIFYPENNGREGLFINIQALSLALFGNEPWALRFPSAVFGILTVLGVYFLTKELFGIWDLKFGISRSEQMALLAAFFLATNFWHINFSRIGFRAIMAPAFLVWGLFLLLKSFNQTKNNFQVSGFKFQVWKLKIRNWALPLLAGAVYSLGFYSYIAYRATPLLLVVSFWLLGFRHGWRKVLKIGSIFTIATIIVALPLIFYFIENPQDFLGRTGQISIFSSPTPLKDLGINILKTLGMFNIGGDWNWRHNIAGRPLLFWPVGILFLIGIFWGLKKNKDDSENANCYKTHDRIFCSNSMGFKILLGWLIVVALPVVISNEGIPHALRSILMIPAVFIIAATAGQIIHAWLKSRAHHILLHVFYLLFFLILILEAFTNYFVHWAKNPEVAGAFAEDYVQIGQLLNSLPKEIPKYVVVETPGTLVRGIPMPAQTIMFITDTFSAEKQKERNIYYILPPERNRILPNSFSVTLK